jgi:post-segregation antitoxin (ccd killing protein)
MREKRRRAMKVDVLLGVMVDRELREQVRRAAFEERLSMSGLGRKAIEEYLRRKQGKAGK